MSDSRPVANGAHNAQDKNLQAVQESMLDGLGQLATYFGFSKVMGQLYGALLMSADPLSLDDLVVLLDISKASVSMNLRTLEHMGMVRQVWVRGGGGRRKFYEAEIDFMQIISNVLSSREMRDVDRALTVMDENAKRLSQSMPNMSDDEKRLAELYLERMTQMQALFRFAQTIISSILAKAGDLDLEHVSRIDIQ
jgi:DNA-binding transcriptional regulator GbsR (MarR family)